ncbi:MAG: hypothetical protein KIS62_12290 [Ramlibacter sp.]|nr:hypothetical protein [Ramlibacter sp.]
MFEIGAAVAAFSAVKDLGVALVGERDRQKATAIEVEFTNKLIEAQSHLTQLLGTVIDQQGHIATLEKRLREMETSRAEKERYVLAKLGVGREFFAYRLRGDGKDPQGLGEVDHFICQPCLEGDKKVVLNFNGDGYCFCPVCGHGAQVAPARAVEFGPRGGDFSDF